MATTYTATVNVQCLKEHTCVGCEGKYSYLLTREIKGTGGTQQAAMTNAQNKALKSMENDVDFHACPACGIVQPEMVADIKSGKYWTGIVIGSIILIVALICGLAQGMRISTSAYLALAGGGITALFYGLGTIYNANTNLQLNMSKSQQSIESKQIVVIEPSTPTNVVDQFSGIQLGNIVGMVFAIAAIIALAMPIVLPVVNGWHFNDSIYPAVAGPGDTPTFYFDSKIKSLKGKWNGTVGVTVNNPDELGVQAKQLTGKTKSETWGNEIDDETNTNKMWASVSFPKSLGDLNGKVGDFDFVVRTNFPAAVGAGFANRNQVFNHKAKMTFSKPNAGSTYYSSWFYGQLSALLMLMIAAGCHIGSAGWLRRQGNPTTVTTLGEAAEEFDEEQPLAEGLPPAP